MGRKVYWTLDKIFEVAARCRTYSEFYTRHPNVYFSAVKRGWLGAIREHCGWMVDEFGRVIDQTESRTRTLKEEMEEEGSLLAHAMGDPRWPIDVSPEPLKEEIL